MPNSRECTCHRLVCRWLGNGQCMKLLARNLLPRVPLHMRKQTRPLNLRVWHMYYTSNIYSKHLCVPIDSFRYQLHFQSFEWPCPPPSTGLLFWDSNISSSRAMVNCTGGDGPPAREKNKRVTESSTLENRQMTESSTPERKMNDRIVHERKNEARGGWMTESERRIDEWLIQCTSPSTWQLQGRMGWDDIIPIKGEWMN